MRPRQQGLLIHNDFVYCMMINDDEDDHDDAMDIHLSLRLRDRAALCASFHNIIILMSASETRQRQIPASIGKVI